MKTKNTNSLPAKVENIENQNQNTPAPVMDPAAPETQEQEQEQQEQEQEKNEVHHTVTKHLNPRITPKPIKLEQWPNMDSRGWDELPKNATYNFTHRFSSKDFSNGAVLWSGTIETESTTYDFRNCTITQIKELFGLAKASNGGGSYTKSSKGCKSPEDVDAAVYAYKTDIYTAVNHLEELLAKYNTTDKSYYVALGTYHIDDETGKDTMDYGVLCTDIFMDMCRTAKNKELEAHRAKLAEDERKQARKNLRDASDEDKDLAATVVGMNEWQKRMTAATAANDYAAIAALLVEKQNSETAA